MKTLPCALLLLATVTSAQVAPRYTLTRLNPFGEHGTGWGIGLSDTGFVAASYLDGGTGASVGFAWTVGGVGVSSAQLAFPPPAGVAWTTSLGTAINASGVAVGQFGTGGYPYDLTRGFRFQGGVSLELFGPEGTPGLPTALNRAGWIVGSTATAAGPRAVLWSPSLVASYLDPLEAAHDINDAGVVLGSIDTATIPRAVVLEGGVVTELGDLEPLAQAPVRAAALNNLGHAVGSTRLGGREVAFRWTRATGMTQLAPCADPLGGPDQARDIDDQGRVVGLASDRDAGTVPVLWTADGARHPLGERVPRFVLGLSAPFRINSAGQIVAWGFPDPYRTAWVLLTPAELESVALAPAQAGQPYVVEVHGARPGRVVHLAAGSFDPQERGYRALPGGPLGLSIPTPRLVARASADASGDARLTWNVPSSAAGNTLRLQAFQLAPTRVSNLLRETP